MPNRTPTPKKTTTQRGYGNNHRQARNRLINRHIDGRKCTWCKRPMFRDRTKNWDYNPNATRTDGKPDLTSGALAAHHPDGDPTRNTANELMHGLCNKQCGEPGTREHLRPTLTIHDTNQTDTELGALVMQWP